jgi:hypothetical protein
MAIALGQIPDRLAVQQFLYQLFGGLHVSFSFLRIAEPRAAVTAQKLLSCAVRGRKAPRHSAFPHHLNRLKPPEAGRVSVKENKHGE